MSAKSIPENGELDLIPAADQNFEIDPMEAEEASLLQTMQMVLAESDVARVRVKLYRIRALTKKMEWCEDFSPDQIQEGGFPMIRAKFGPGDYQLRLIGPKGLVKVTPISIAADAAPMQPQPALAGSSGSDVSEVLRTLAENQSRMMDALTNRPQVDPMQQMKTMVELMTMVQALQQKPQPPADPMAMFREMMGAAREMKEFQKEIASPEPAEDDSLTGIIKSVAPILQSAVGGGNTQQQFQPLPPLSVPPSLTAQSEQQPKEENAMQMNHAKLLVLGVIEDLCDMAEASKDVDDGARLALDKLPDEILDLLDNRYWWQILSAEFPVVKKHATWFSDVRKKAIEIMKAEPPDNAG